MNLTIERKKVTTMSKKVTNDQTNVIDESDEQFGPIVEIAKATSKKEEIRDYTKTPDVIKLLEKYGSKSAAIRGLHKEGYKLGQIADTLRIRYQHVNNVLNQKYKGQ
jgi:indole-3-glycerol phosphate synthase